MRNETLVRIHRAMEMVDEGHARLLAFVLTVVIAPFMALWLGAKYVVCKARGMVYDTDSGEWTTKEEMERELQKERIQKREEPLPQDNHVTVGKDDRFMFFRKRKLTIPHDQLVYVEAEHSEEMHRFFAENTEWMDMWQKWHGWDIVHYPEEDIMEGMFYPRDFAVFKHGFLWHTPMFSWDKESGVYGSIHYYYEINPDSDVSIKEQMESMMRKIYGVMDY